ncbi:nitroreductase [Xylophilus sp. GW821-FHT01B05]
MQVAEALNARVSTRAFLDKPVPVALVKDILVAAGRSPSGGNLQPWHIWALTGETLNRFRSLIRERAVDLPMGEGTEYKIYPPDLSEPYKTRRYKNGEDLYRVLGIPREDKEARKAQFKRNFEFFGAPVGLILTIDRQMQPGQWADLGMYLQSVMLLAQERGLNTCAQEGWALWHKSIGEFLGLPPHLMVFCGMALGYGDASHPVNSLRTDRAPDDEFLTILE